MTDGDDLTNPARVAPTNTTEEITAAARLRISINLELELADPEVGTALDSIKPNIRINAAQLEKVDGAPVRATRARHDMMGL